MNDVVRHNQLPGHLRLHLDPDLLNPVEKSLDWRGDQRRAVAAYIRKVCPACKMATDHTSGRFDLLYWLID